MSTVTTPSEPRAGDTILPTQWVPVAKASDLETESAKVVQVSGLSLALFRGKKGYYAVDNACPHAGAPLGEGLVQGECIVCPMHAWKFEGGSGACVNEKCKPLTRYEVKTEKGQLFVAIPSSPAANPGEEWTEALGLGALPKGSLKKVSLKGRNLVLIHTGQGISALLDACVHEGGSLAEGSISGDCVTCPLHGWKFDVKTGACRNDGRFCQPAFETRLDGDRILVKLPAQAEAKTPEDPSTQRSAVEIWKAAKHGLDAWDDLLRYAREATPMSAIDPADLERMKWYGFFYRKTNDFDRYMTRVRIPGCELSARQMKALAFIAYESGYSILDLTTRGNIQIQGLTIEKLPGLYQTMLAVGLDVRQTGHDNVRNVSASPLSGLDPEEVLDTRQLARDLSTLILGHREFSNLPRKMNLATYGRPDAPAHAWTQDLAFVANRAENGRLAYHLLLGGSQGSASTLAWCAPVWVEPGEAVDVADAVLRTFNRLGYRHNRHQVRFHFLMERLGTEQTLSEIEQELGRPLRRTRMRPPAPRREEDFIGWLPQKQEGYFALGVNVPVGRLSWDQAKSLAEIAEQFGDGTLRTTLDQNLVIPNILAEARDEAELRIAALGLSGDADANRRTIVSCTGKQFCNLAVTETKGFALRLMAELRRRRVSLKGVTVHFSGCPNSCGMTQTADIGLQGNKARVKGEVTECFDVYLGGGVNRDGVHLAKLYQKAVPFRRLGQFLEERIRLWHRDRAAGESFSEFWRERLRDHQPEALGYVPEWACSKCGYESVGEVPPPSCPVCSAIRSKFDPVDPDKPKTPILTEPPKPAFKPPAKKLLIVGGSIAAHTAALEARKLDPSLVITLLTDEKDGYYNRLNLTRFLNRELPKERLFEFPDTWYQEQGVELKTDSRVISLDPNEKKLLLEDGRLLAYDQCILAHGASASLPPFYRELEGLRPLRTLQDVEHLLSRIEAGTPCVVVGGGVLGIEGALGLAGRGAAVTLLERASRLMPRQLVREASTLLQARLEAKGIRVLTGAHVKAVEGTDHLEGYRLEDGGFLPCTASLVTAGIQPNIEWVKASGIDCERGIVVDDAMRTNAPGVFACGDVAEWRGEITGLWAPALEQAAVAAASACGKEAEYKGVLVPTQLKCLDWDVLSLGEILEDGDGISSRTECPDPELWKRVVFRNGIPIGAILLGTTSGMGSLRRLVEQGQSLDRLARQVLVTA